MVEFNKLIQEKFDVMCQNGRLFRVDITGNELWDIYINSFPPEYNPVFRDPNSTSKNCNHCKNFMRRYGNIVTIDEDYKIFTMFDVDAGPEYAAAAVALSEAIKGAKIIDVFFETYDELQSLPYESCSKSNKVFQLGVAKNPKRYTKEEAEKFGVVKPDEIRTFYHMHLFLPKAFVDTTGKSIDSIKAGFRDAKEVFQRAMETIHHDTLMLVADLINQGSLLDGQTHKHKVLVMAGLKKAYDSLNPMHRENWFWVISYNLRYAKFRNELIGQLCVELSEGLELNAACRAWNERVDPVNYMKATAPITKQQIEEAKKFVEENGYTESFNRRHATIEDINISEILHTNSGDGKLKAASIFDGVKSTYSMHKRNEFDSVEEVPIEKFMTDILPGCTAIDAFLMNSHKGNMVSITTANDPESKPIFKWSNNYSWTFNGNLAGKSQIKAAVKGAGGNIDGQLRFSMVWNEDGKDKVDFDLHATEPGLTHIYWSTNFRRDRSNLFTKNGGQLDVDMINPPQLGVENIYWRRDVKMQPGAYKLWVNNFNSHANKGFRAEVAFGDHVYTYEIKRDVRGDVAIAEVILKDGVFTINHIAQEAIETPQELYNLQTNSFHRVNLVCLSPNHWGANNAGNKHYFFMLENCMTIEPIRGFHMENLLPELAQHRKVLEVLGATQMIPAQQKQLSGLGFNATVRDELIVKLQGTHKRIIKIKF